MSSANTNVLGSGSNVIRDMRLKAAMRYHRGSMVLIGTIITLSLVYGIVSTEDVIGGASLVAKSGRGGGFGVEDAAKDKAVAAKAITKTRGNGGGVGIYIWNLFGEPGTNLLKRLVLFPMKFFLSGLITLTTGEMAIIVFALGFWVAISLQRVLGGAKFLQLVGLMCAIRLPVWVAVYVLISPIVGGEGMFPSSSTAQSTVLPVSDGPQLLVQPSAAWLVSATHTVTWWIVPPKLKFTLLNTLPLTEYVFGWLLILHLSLIRLPFSFLDSIIGMIVGTLAVSRYCRLNSFYVSKRLEEIFDPIESLIWHTTQDLSRPTPANAQQSAVNHATSFLNNTSTRGETQRRSDRSARAPAAQHDDGAATPIPSPGAPPPQISESTLQLFESLGFDRTTTEQAMIRANNDADRALDSLLNAQATRFGQ